MLNWIFEEYQNYVIPNDFYNGWNTDDDVKIRDENVVIYKASDV